MSLFTTEEISVTGSLAAFVRVVKIRKKTKMNARVLGLLRRGCDVLWKNLFCGVCEVWGFKKMVMT